MSHAHLHSVITGAIVRKQQERSSVDRYPALLLPMACVREDIDHYILGYMSHMVL